MDRTPMDDMCDSLVEKGRVHLEVNINSREDALALFKMMYSEEDRVIDVQSIEWDQVLVPIEVAEAVLKIYERMQITPALSFPPGKHPYGD